MNTLLFLKLLADLFLYFTLGETALFVFGHSSFPLWELLFCAGAGFLCQLLRKQKPLLRPLPLLLLTPLFLLIKDPFVHGMLTPLCLYLLIQALKGFPLPERSGYGRRFAALLIAYTPAAAIIAIASKSAAPLSASALPCLFGYILAAAAVLRALRQDRIILESAAFQLSNLGVVCGAGLGAAVLSLGLRWIAKGLALLLGLLFSPVGLLARELMKQPVSTAPLPTALPFTASPAAGPTATPLPASTAIPLEIGESREILPIWAWALLGIAAACLVTGLLFLFRKNREEQAGEGLLEKREGAQGDPEEEQASLKRRGSRLKRMRRLYRSFLRACAAGGVSLSAADTSLRVEGKAEALFNKEELQLIRALYIKARYKPDWEAEPKDLKIMEETVKKLRKR